MFRLYPTTKTLACEWLTALGISVPDLPMSDKPVPEGTPLLHIPYRDFQVEWLDNILGYENLVSVSPLGIPGLKAVSRTKISERDEVVLFPLEGLRHHIEALIPELVARAAAVGGIAELYCRLDQDEEVLPPHVDLALAVLEVVKYSHENLYPLRIRY